MDFASFGNLILSKYSLIRFGKSYLFMKALFSLFLFFLINTSFSQVIDTSAGNYKKENLGGNINSEYEEIGPVITQDGKTLFLDRTNHPDNTEGTKNDDI